MLETNKFKDLEAGSHIYMIEISTQKILSYPIKNITGMPGNHVQIEFFNVLPRLNLVNDAVVESAKEMGRIEDLPTTKLIVPMLSKMIYTREIPPRIFAATKETLETWMKESLK